MWSQIFRADREVPIVQLVEMAKVVVPGDLSVVGSKRIYALPKTSDFRPKGRSVRAESAAMVKAKRRTKAPIFVLTVTAPGIMTPSRIKETMTF